MQVGTKSLLFGVHCWFIHPFMVAIAWWKLYGFPKDYRLWVAFLVHDWGYWESTDMDGAVGRHHPFFGAKLMSRWFDKPVDSSYPNIDYVRWYNFCLYHSRSIADEHGQPPSKLCIADKYAICIEPGWLYIPRAKLSGELHEYLMMAKGRLPEFGNNPWKWHKELKTYMQKWVDKNKSRAV